jgi:hypothetical protein
MDAETAAWQRANEARSITLTMTAAEAALVVEVLDAFVAEQGALAAEAEVVERRLLRACERHPSWPLLLKQVKASLGSGR